MVVDPGAIVLTGGAAVLATPGVDASLAGPGEDATLAGPGLLAPDDTAAGLVVAGPLGPVVSTPGVP